MNVVRQRWDEYLPKPGFHHAEYLIGIQRQDHTAAELAQPGRHLLNISRITPDRLVELVNEPIRGRLDRSTVEPDDHRPTRLRFGSKHGEQAGFADAANAVHKHNGYLAIVDEVKELFDFLPATDKIACGLLTQPFA